MPPGIDCPAAVPSPRLGGAEARRFLERGGASDPGRRGARRGLRRRVPAVAADRPADAGPVAGVWGAAAVPLGGAVGGRIFLQRVGRLFDTQESALSSEQTNGLADVE